MWNGRQGRKLMVNNWRIWRTCAQHGKWYNTRNLRDFFINNQKNKNHEAKLNAGFNEPGVAYHGRLGHSDYLSFTHKSPKGDKADRGYYRVMYLAGRDNYRGLLYLTYWGNDIWCHVLERTMRKYWRHGWETLLDLKYKISQWLHTRSRNTWPYTYSKNTIRKVLGVEQTQVC